MSKQSDNFNIHKYIAVSNINVIKKLKLLRYNLGIFFWGGGIFLGIKGMDKELHSKWKHY